MAFLSSLNIAASGMAAERLRLDVISQNVANAKTTRTEDGTPYRRQVVLFSENKGFNSVLEETIAKRKEKIAGGVPANTVSATKNKGVLVTEIVEDETPLTPVYDPTHPDADENGYYYLPNVDVAEEEMDAMAATRSYEANLAVPLRYNYDKPEKPRISRVFGYLARFFILFQTEKSSREVIIS